MPGARAPGGRLGRDAGGHVITPGGCHLRVSYAQTAADLTENGAWFPNIITPNGDRLNDRWAVPNLPAGARLRIYGRWGQLVYESSNYHNDWAAEGQPAGQYYYLLEQEQLCPKPQVKGWIEMVR